MAVGYGRAAAPVFFVLSGIQLSSFCCNGLELNGFIGPVVGKAIDSRSYNYNFNFFPSVLQCAQWCDRSAKCKSFSWGDRGNVVILVTDGVHVYRFGHCVLSSVNRTIASLSDYPNYDFYEELAQGPVVDPDGTAISGFIGPFQGTGTSAFDDINEEAYNVASPGECAKMCTDRKECRSFDYGARGSVEGQCWLSRVDRESAGPMFTVWHLYDYYEKLLETIAFRVEERQDLKILAGALASMSLLDLLANTGPFTFFAPSDQAFRDQGINSAAELLALPNVTAILEYHIGLGRFEVSSLAAGDQLLTAHGEKVDVTQPSGTLEVGGESVSIPDIECSNGVIHVMTGVLSAPSYTKEPIIDMLASRGYTELRQALQASNIADEAGSQWTLFAPSDIAIRAFRLTEGITDANAFLVSDEMRMLLRRHIIPRDTVLTSSADDGEREFTALAGNTLRLTRTPGGRYFVYSDGAVAAVGPFDLIATDGVLHVIDRLLAEPERSDNIPGRLREEGGGGGSDDDDGVGAGVIIGAVVAALVVVLIGFAAVFMWHKRQKANIPPPTNVQQDGVHVVMGKPVPGQEPAGSSAAAASSSGAAAGSSKGGKGKGDDDDP